MQTACTRTLIAAGAVVAALGATALEAQASAALPSVADWRHDLTAMVGGRPTMVTYDTRPGAEDVFGPGLGCDGAITVALVPIGAAARRELCVLRDLLAGGRPAALVIDFDPGARVAVSTVVDGPEVPTCNGGAPRLSGATGRERFVEPFVPAPGLTVFGGGLDASPLLRLALEAGFRVTLVDHRGALLRAGADVGARCVRRPAVDGTGGLAITAADFAVVKMHHEAHDRSWLGQLLDTPIRYIGLLGSRRRATRLLDTVGAANDPRVFAPVGLDLGADGPDEVALSIMAELLAVHGGRAGRHLRRRGTGTRAPAS